MQNNANQSLFTIILTQLPLYKINICFSPKRKYLTWETENEEKVSKALNFFGATRFKHDMF